MIEKNKEYIVDIIDNGFDGEGIAKIDNFTIFIPQCLKGEKVKILIVKVLKSYAYGKILEIIKKSNNRQESDCTTFRQCGGCSLRYMEYNETLNIKKNMIQALIDKTLKSKVEIKSILGMKNPYHYRNKAIYPIGKNKEGLGQIGVFAKRSHNIIPIDKCLIQDEDTEKIAKSIERFIKDNQISIYDEKTKKGLFRHIIIRKGMYTNEIMCILVINGKEIPKEKELIKFLIDKFNVKTIVKNINTKNTNVILGEKNITIYGDGIIKDKIEDLEFNISPNSFYQVNSIQTEKLYNLAIENAKITKEDVVFDLYCGIGTITLFASKYAKKVYGIEIVEEAIKMANQNAKINNIDNIDFICGDVEKSLTELIEIQKVNPDIVIVDPPRKGLDNTTINNLLKTNPKKIVYISCNPATLIRDLSKLEEVYTISSINGVDMFPWTSHVECICCLESKK